jgi:hypothetical protein
MLNNLREKQGYLVPDWWKGSPQQFEDELTSQVTALSSNEKSTMAERQSLLLEALLNMWEEVLSGQLTPSTPTPM